MTVPEPNNRRRPTRRRPRRFLENLLDPDKERPILKLLLQTFGPILMDFLTTKLPLLLAAQQPEDADDELNA